MADLPTGSFVSVNDIETAQGAPVSEALAQKEGSNDNNLDSRVTPNTAGIATNTAALANLINFITATLSAVGTVYTCPANRRFVGTVKIVKSSGSLTAAATSLTANQNGVTRDIARGDASTTIPSVAAGSKSGSLTVSSTVTVYLAAGEIIVGAIAGPDSGLITFTVTGHELKEQV